MKVDNIYELIKEVSKLGVSSFEYEEDGSRIAIKFCDGNEPSEATETVLKDVKKTENEKKYIVSPIVGTFYASSTEGGEPYVKRGDRIKKGDVVAIIEAMKLMNELKSEYDGEIVDVLVENGDAVEYGQPLFEIV